MRQIRTIGDKGTEVATISAQLDKIMPTVTGALTSARQAITNLLDQVAAQIDSAVSVALGSVNETKAKMSALVTQAVASASSELDSKLLPISTTVSACRSELAKLHS